MFSPVCSFSGEERFYTFGWTKNWRELTHAGQNTLHKLTQAACVNSRRGILRSSIGREQNMLGKEQDS